jgi:sigma-B regulation protein RsbU (phosphoserine phosphatase)
MKNDVQEILRFVQRENVRLKRENEELRREVSMLHGVLDALRALQDVSTSINPNTDALHLLDRILESALTSISASDGSLLLVDGETKELAFAVVHGAVRDTLMGHRIAPATGIAGWVAQHAEPVIVSNARRDPRFSPEIDRDFQFYTRSMLCVPIVYGDQVWGVIQALNKADGEEFNDADLALFEVVAQLAAAAMVKAELVFASDNAES